MYPGLRKDRSRSFRSKNHLRSLPMGTPSSPPRDLINHSFIFLFCYRTFIKKESIKIVHPEGFCKARLTFLVSWQLLGHSITSFIH